MDKYFTLSNGVKLPKIGYGTYKCTDGSDERGSCITGVRVCLHCS